jgi:glycosyltransferase involved in cell wall biosynthesis
MKILVAHNSYQHRGGEDVVVDSEIALLREYGHDVEFYQRHNDELQTISLPAAAVSTIWAQRSASDLERLCEKFRPNVIHVHNTLPLISPSLYWVATRRNIPIVQTLHNFRLICPQAMLLRNGKVCEDCLGKVPWRAVVRKCYRQSTVQSAVLSGMLMTHHALGTYRDKITRYIALNNFCREKFVASGLAPELFRIKPNFVKSRVKPDNKVTRKGGIFIGRLSPEKGLHVLIDAAKKIRFNELKIVGKGPLEDDVRNAFNDCYLGYKTPEQVQELLQACQFLVAPSTCYETFGLVAIEAFACGTPVIASRHGGLGELITDGVTGLLFTPGDAEDLARKIEWAKNHPEEMMRMGVNARAEYEAQYTPERNYQMLIDIYEDAIQAVEGVQYAA